MSINLVKSQPIFSPLKTQQILNKQRISIFTTHYICCYTTYEKKTVKNDTNYIVNTKTLASRQHEHTNVLVLFHSGFSYWQGCQQGLEAQGQGLSFKEKGLKTRIQGPKSRTFDLAGIFMQQTQIILEDRCVQDYVHHCYFLHLLHRSA